MKEDDLQMIDMILAAKEGNKDILQNIIERFMPFVYKSAAGIYIKDMDYQDLKQIGIYSIINAVKKFDLTRNTSCISYIINSITNNYKYEIKKAVRNNYVISLDAPLKDNISLRDMLKDNQNLEQEYIEKEEISAINKVLQNLPKVKKDLLCKSSKEYADEYGISIRAVYKRRYKLRLKLLYKIIVHMSIILLYTI